MAENPWNPSHHKGSQPLLIYKAYRRYSTKEKSKSKVRLQQLNKTHLQQVLQSTNISSLRTWYMEITWLIHPISYQDHTGIIDAYDPPLGWMQIQPLAADHQVDIITFLELGIKCCFGTSKKLYFSSSLRIVNSRMSYFFKSTQKIHKILPLLSTGRLATITHILKTLIYEHACVWFKNLLSL